MTLVIALVWRNGVLVSADSRASAGPVYHEERKIYPIYFRKDGVEYDLAIAGGAGDAALVKQGFMIVEDAFREWFEEHGGFPGEDDLRSIVSAIESRLMARYRELRSLGVEPSASLLVASVTRDGRPHLYVFDDRGLAEPVHDNPGYALLGRGAVTGGLLLLRLLDYRPGLAWDWDLGLLSAFIIDVVSEVDPSVSPFLGESYFIRYEEGRVVGGRLRLEAYREYKERVGKRREAFRRLWELMEKLGEEEVLKALEELERRGGGLTGRSS